MRYSIAESFAKLMKDNKVSAKQLAAVFGVDVTTIRNWRSDRRGIKLSNAVKIANNFGCTLEYLIGRAEYQAMPPVSQECPPFFVRLKQLMDQHGVSRYRLVCDKAVDDYKFENWQKGADPCVNSVVRLADYFNSTVDLFLYRTG